MGYNDDGDDEDGDDDDTDTDEPVPPDEDPPPNLVLNEVMTKNGFSFKGDGEWVGGWGSTVHERRKAKQLFRSLSWGKQSR